MRTGRASRAGGQWSIPARRHGARRRPHIGSFAFAYRREDRERAQLSLDDASLAEERDQRQHAFGQFRAVQHDAERSAYAAEDLHHLVDDAVMFGWNVGLAADRSNSRHDFSPLSDARIRFPPAVEINDVGERPAPYRSEMADRITDRQDGIGMKAGWDTHCRLGLLL